MTEYWETFVCPECGGIVSFTCAASDGDGDLYDEWACENGCGYTEKHNIIWDEDDWWDDEDEEA